MKSINSEIERAEKELKEILKIQQGTQSIPFDSVYFEAISSKLQTLREVKRLIEHKFKENVLEKSNLTKYDVIAFKKEIIGEAGE